MRAESLIWTWIFLVKGVYNVVLSVALLIWPDRLLPLLSGSVGNPVYAQLFLMLCLAFGVGYILVALEIDRNHGLVAVGILGQTGLFVIVALQWAMGNVSTFALLPGVVDLAFAVGFMRFLWCYRYAVKSATCHGTERS
jgi:hypothetical protein